MAEEIPRCHLHRKPNKACKFCKNFVAAQEVKQKQEEEDKKAALEKFKDIMKSGSTALTDQLPLPYFPGSFSPMLRDRVQNHPVFKKEIMSANSGRVLQVLDEACDTAEVEVRNDLDAVTWSGKDFDNSFTVPSLFICAVLRLLTLKLTETELRSMFDSDACLVRCAGFLYVRLGVAFDRYWDLLGDYLLDDEKFIPFPNRDGGESMTVGEYVEMLLCTEKYCDMSIHRIPIAQKKNIAERLCLYGQFRERYAQNLEVLERYSGEHGGVDVEYCDLNNGEWFEGETVGAHTYKSRLVTVPVKNKHSKEVIHVSIGMLVQTRGSSSLKDLTRNKGLSNKELIEKYRDQQRSSAVASGKDYTKNTFRHFVRAGGVAISVGGKYGGNKQEQDHRNDSDDEETLQRESKRRRETQERDAKMQKIMDKYCSGGAQNKGGGSSKEDEAGEERMRLG